MTANNKSRPGFVTRYGAIVLFGAIAAALILLRVLQPGPERPVAVDGMHPSGGFAYRVANGFAHYGAAAELYYYLQSRQLLKYAYNLGAGAADNRARRQLGETDTVGGHLRKSGAGLRPANSGWRFGFQV